MNTRNISNILISAATGAVSGYAGPALLSTVNLVNPANVIPIAMASTVGNAALTFVAGNNVENTAKAGILASGVLIGAPGTEHLPVTKTFSLFAETTAFAAREAVGAGFGVGLLLLAGVSSAPLPVTVAATMAGGIAVGTGTAITLGLLICLGLKTFTNIGAIIGMEVFNQRDHRFKP